MKFQFNRQITISLRCPPLFFLFILNEMIIVLLVSVWHCKQLRAPLVSRDLRARDNAGQVRSEQPFMSILFHVETAVWVLLILGASQRPREGDPSAPRLGTSGTRHTSMISAQLLWPGEGGRATSSEKVLSHYIHHHNSSLLTLVKSLPKWKAAFKSLI